MSEDCGIKGCSGPVKGRGWGTQEPTSMEASFDSRCPNCDEEIYEGDFIFKDEAIDMWVCESCKP